jgi:carboxyl-terminal processing protease
MLKTRFALLAVFVCCILRLSQASLADGPPVEQMKAARAQDAQIIKACSILMSKMHLAGHPLDDEISSRAYDSLLRSLDPLKVYFLQSDLVEFEKNRNKLDDAAKAGKIDFAIDLYKLFLKRMDERIEAAHQYVDQEHDFTIEESIVKDSGCLALKRIASD